MRPFIRMDGCGIVLDFWIFRVRFGVERVRRIRRVFETERQRDARYGGSLMG